ncbi:unnamed protein product [Rotaria socialis]|uniref:Peptidase S1 domain-containing protein n=1 Tax=Rotaria socialis TaxID=392032 RepID=A0A817RBL8_9BILA|nr:unnamed protein product [Rotaria socialis]CAF3248664.1 unnamed protein product [Rotaria socialis]CAF3703971.1 unnamed protein product [Rotaria socialis]CAF3761165.1 unnamed protein product [Rotaria socialis]CAF4484246.1 unnamed protein product [Rotaria socialis]
MYILLILLISFPLNHGECNYTTEWFNENHPWETHSNGHDIERYSIIRAKYPLTFDITQWTGSFEIRKADDHRRVDPEILIENYTKIHDGFICHAINGKLCADFEIRFCLEYKPCSVSTYPLDESPLASGTEVRPHSLPWHVSIQYKEQHLCSGTLIDDQHVLTAASCFQSNLIHIPYSVALDAHYLSNSTYRIPIDRFIFHSDFNQATLINDIAVIKLSQHIQSFSDRIRPACLARSIRQPDVSSLLIVAGWRTVKNNTWSVSNTNELRQARLTAMDECSEVYPKRYDFEKQICAGTQGSKRDLCLGDMGSGLFEKRKHDVDRWILTGIVSYGCEFASNGYPGVYVRISHYYDWIQHTIKKLNERKKTK